MEHIVKIKDIENITHDVKKFTVEKPENYSFDPGQATSVSINNDKWKDEKRPFTFTSLNSDKYIEFIIKIYHDHNGVTNELDKLSASDELIIEEPWGAIKYKGAGYFISGGAGITPFIAIFRDLQKNKKIAGNTLFFSNKSEKDIILKDELENILGNEFINVITDEKNDKYINEFIDKDFLKKHVNNFSQNFYVCGPPKMTKDINKALNELGVEADALIFEN